MMADEVAPPPSDVVGATARRAELIGSPDFRDRYLAGNVEARNEMAFLNATIVAGASTETPIEEAFAIETLRAEGCSEAVVEQYMKKDPIPQSERALALQWKQRHLADEAWVKRFFAGDIEARRQMKTCNMLLSLPVKEA